jgi:tetratricopeptide (TPR) repeat protein
MATVPWNDDSQRVRELHDQARQARDDGRFAEAADLFRQSYDLHASAFAASRYLHCMRRQSADKARAAVQFAREPVDRWPLDTWLIREYCWAIYDGYLKQNTDEEEEEEGRAEGRPGFEVRVKAARRILKLSREDLPRARAMFAICREAKAHGQWDLALEFAQAIDPATLSDDPRQMRGQTLPSDRQQWLYLVTRAHLELGHYDECLELAREGRDRYPVVLFFPWWHALAQVRQGHVEAGLRELEEVHRRFVSPWYIRRDIAEAYAALGWDEDAWRWYCAAARSAGDLRSRASMLLCMSETLARLSQLRPALDHLLLAWALAAREKGWEKPVERVREQLAVFLPRHSAHLGVSAELPEAPPDIEPLLAGCRQAWREAGPPTTHT